MSQEYHNKSYLEALKEYRNHKETYAPKNLKNSKSKKTKRSNKKSRESHQKYNDRYDSNVEIRLAALSESLSKVIFCLDSIEHQLNELAKATKVMADNLANTQKVTSPYAPYPYTPYPTPYPTWQRGDDTTTAHPNYHVDRIYCTTSSDSTVPNIPEKENALKENI